MTVTRTRRVSVAAVSLLAALSLGLTACTDGGFAGGADEVNTIDAGVASSIDETIAQALQLSQSTEAVVGVWTSSGEYVKGYGEGVSASTSIRAGQASQPVMCALLLDLVADDTLSLNREVSEDLPRQVGIEGITYGDLCSATSGLAEFKVPSIVDIFVNNPTRPWSDRELLAHSLARSPLNEPGAEQHVSDTNALLLARALRQATGISVNQLLDARVFTPADMNRSSYPSDVLAATELPNSMTALTYRFANQAPVCTVPGEEEGSEVAAEPTVVEAVSPSMLSGAGATVTTVTDLKRFYERYLAGDYGLAGDASLITELWTPPTPEPAEGDEAPAEEEGEPAEPPTSGWTFGLHKQDNLYGMSGAMTGTLTAAYHDPASGFTVVVALNNSSAGAGFAQTLAFQLAAIAGAEVPWSAEDQGAALAEKAICQPAAEEASE